MTRRASLSCVGKSHYEVQQSFCCLLSTGSSLSPSSFLLKEDSKVEKILACSAEHRKGKKDTTFLLFLPRASPAAFILISGCNEEKCENFLHKENSGKYLYGFLSSNIEISQFEFSRQKLETSSVT